METQRAACKQLMWSLQSELKEWLAHISASSGCTFRYNVLPQGEHFELRVSVGNERLTVTVVDPDTVQADDPVAERSVTTGMPFLAGISPVLMGAIEREMARQAQR